MWASASGARPASRVAIARASSASASAGTTATTSPNRSASAADSDVPEQCQLGGLGRSDQPWQEPRRAAVGHQPDPPEREHEARPLRRDAQVAGERERRPGPGRDAVDRADDRLGQRAHRPDDRVVALADLDRERGRVGFEPFLEVLAGTERPAGAGQHDRPHGPVPPDRPERGEQLGLHRDRQRVERLGPIERDGRDAVGDLGPDERTGRVAGGRVVGHRRRSDPGEVDEPPVHELEDAAVDRFVRAARLLDDEVGEQGREVRVVRPQRGGRQEVAFGQADEDAPDRPELRDDVVDDLGQQDPRGIPAVARCPS